MDNEQLTEQERSEYMRELEFYAEAINGDTEHAHVVADMILCEALVKLGYSDIVDAWDKIEKWYA